MRGGGTAAAEAAPRRAATGQGKSALVLPKLETFKLDNGLQVAFMHRDGAPVVSIEVWYHVGSKDEQPHRRGSAHMFEHMMFKGTKHVPPEAHAQEINRLGGYVNAQHHRGRDPLLRDPAGRLPRLRDLSSRPSGCATSSSART